MKVFVVGALISCVMWSDQALAQAKFVNPGQLPCSVRKQLGLCHGPCNDVPGGSSCPKGFTADDPVIVGEINQDKKEKIINVLRGN